MSPIVEGGLRSDDILRLRLSRPQENTKVHKCGRDTARQSHVESIPTQTTYHCKEQRGVRNVRSSVGGVRLKSHGVVVVRSRLRAQTSAGNRSEGHRTHLHRQGTGRLKHIDVALLWIQDEIRSNRLKVRRVKSEKNVADLVTKALDKSVITKHSITLRHAQPIPLNGAPKRSGSQKCATHIFFWPRKLTCPRTPWLQRRPGCDRKDGGHASRLRSSGRRSMARSTKRTARSKGSAGVKVAATLRHGLATPHGGAGRQGHRAVQGARACVQPQRHCAQRGTDSLCTCTQEQVSPRKIGKFSARLASG